MIARDGYGSFEKLGMNSESVDDEMLIDHERT